MPLWPDYALEGAGGAARNASRSVPGALWERSGSAKTPLHAMDKWTRANNHKQITQTVTKKQVFQKKTPDPFEKNEIAKESHRFSTLCDTFLRKPHAERINIG